MPSIYEDAFIKQRNRKRVEGMVDKAHSGKVTGAYDMLHDNWE